DVRLCLGLPGEILAPFADAGRLALQVAEVVELGAAYAAAAHHLDAVDRRRVEREDALDADAARHLARGEGLADAAALPADDDALEDLDALLVAFHHLDVHAHGVSGAEIRQPVLEERGFDDSQRFHGDRSLNPMPLPSGGRRAAQPGC